MSNQEFENYIALIGKLLQLTQGQRDQIAGELQDHLQMRVADLESEGVQRQDAISQTLEEFGDAAAMARNFQSVINHKKRRWMMRFVTFSIAGSFLAAVLLMAMWPGDSHFGAPSNSIAQDNKAVEVTESTDESNLRFSPGTEATIKAEQALNLIANLNYDDVPFSDVMEELSGKYGLNLVLSSSARDDSLTADETVSCNLKNIPLSKALRLILRPKNATYVIDDGVVVFISLDDAGDTSWFRLKTYDCRDLIRALPKTARRNPIPSRLGWGGGGGTFSVPQGLPAPAKDDNAGDAQSKSDGPDMSVLLDKKLNPILTVMQSDLEKNRPEPTSESTLVNLVESMVEPDSWQNSGQGLGLADAVNGILIVSQSEQIQQQVEQLVIDLEARVLRTKE